jgi:hypothetical protein
MTSPAEATKAPRTVPFPSRRVILPALVFLGYAALLIAGFNTGGDARLQALPVYIYLSVLLLVLQVSISENRTVGRLVYIFLTGGFALVYAAEKIFGTSKGNFTLSGYTYIIINILLLLVFVYDAVDRRRTRPTGLDAKTGVSSSPGVRSMSPVSYGAFGTDFAGLAILFYVSSFLLDFLGRQNFPLTRAILSLFGHGPTTTPYVVVNLNQALHLSLANNLNYLEVLDLVIAFGATAAALLFLGLVGVVTTAGTQMQAGAPVRLFGGDLRDIIANALQQVLLSLRLVLGPLVWLIPAFSLGALSNGVVAYLRLSAGAKGTTILDLFNPLSDISRRNIGQGVQNLLLLFIAVAAVILAVSVVEHNGKIILRTLQIFRVAGRIIALTLAFFIYSLAAFNAFLILINPAAPKPFQVGAPGLIALVTGAGFVAYAALRERQPVPKEPARVP